MSESVYVASLLLYGLAALAATAGLTDRRLLVGLGMALVPPTLMMFLLPDDANLTYLAIPMSTGVTIAALVRALIGWQRPLRPGSPSAEHDDQSSRI